MQTKANCTHVYNSHILGGKAYRCLRQYVREGDVITKKLLADNGSGRATQEGDVAVTNFRVLRKVHTNTIRALLRRNGRFGKLLPGRWYEVIED